MIYYDVLLARGYKYDELYDMTLKELKNALEQYNKGLAYQMFKQAYLTGLAFCGKFPKSPEDACKELYPPKKTYKMPDWLKKRYMKQKGVKMNG